MLVVVCLLYLSLSYPPQCFLSLESFDSAKAASVGVTSKGVSKVGKSTANGVSKHGNRAVSSVC